MATKKEVKKQGKIGLPSNLSFRRSLDVSDALMVSILKDGTSKPVIVNEVTVRGAMGNSSAGYDKKGNPLVGKELETAQNPTKPNIQRIDRACLDPESDTLEVLFSMACHGAGTVPDACSREDYRLALGKFIAECGAAGLYEELAARYFWNVVNGRVLWRNACGIPAGCTVVAEGRTLEFVWGMLDRRTFPGKEALGAACDKGAAGIEFIVSAIAAALRGGPLLAIDVALRVRMYNGAEVWPSQEFVEKSQKKREGREISRLLSSRKIRGEDGTVRQGTMHSQKLGNALRTVDEWHGHAGYGAIPVEAFGWLQSELAALRAPSNPDSAPDAYRALENVGGQGEDIASGSFDRGLALYTLAIILRGGVWGVTEKE